MLGMLGGMGPAACAHMHGLLIAQAQAQGASADQDFPACLVLSAAPPATSPLGWGADAGEGVCRSLCAGSCLLAQAGAGAILPACNTACAYASHMEQASGLPVLGLPSLAARAAAGLGLHSVGVISSRTARDEGLHARALDEWGLASLALDEAGQGQADALIGGLMGRPATPQDEALLRRLGEGLMLRGAEAVIVGCTELSLCAPQDEAYLDAAALGCARALEWAWGEEGVAACA
jgi:aspartate racemase